MKLPVTLAALRRLPFATGVVVPLAVALGGCIQFGPRQLDADQIDYARSLSISAKKQTLLNVVRLRYGDMPTFLDTTQVISSYQLQRNVSGGFEVFPSAAISTYLTGSGSAQLQQSPTFTFQPLAGEEFAESLLRPLAPSDLLPLTVGGLPVDVLFRLSVQAIGRYTNTTGLVEGAGEGSPEFFLLLHDLRQMQIAGLLSIRVERPGKPRAAKDAKSHPGEGGGEGGGEDRRIFLTFAPAGNPAIAAVAAEARRLLGLAPKTLEAEIVYGRFAPHPGAIAILTRSMMGVLSQLAFQINVPAADIAAGRTMASVGEVGIERRPVVIVQNGPRPPKRVYTSVQYDDSWYWIADTDFDSKVAFSIVSVLLDLAKTSSAPGAVVTIPAG